MPDMFFQMPPINRAAFANDEDYQRAVATSAASRDWGAAGTTFFCGLDQIATILLRFVNAAHAVGMGVLRDADVTAEQMNALVAHQLKLSYDRILTDYIAGRPIKTNFYRHQSGQWKFDTGLYNRDQGGTGTGERLIADLGLTIVVDA